MVLGESQCVWVGCEKRKVVHHVHMLLSEVLEVLNMISF